MALTRALLHISIFSHCALAVTVIPLTPSFPKPYQSDEKPISSSKDLLSKLELGMANDTVYYSSYNGQDPGIYASQDSFVRGAIDAGAKHQHLMVRPQDVWLTILKQLGSYMRKHKDDKEVQAIWDNHDGATTFPLHFMVMNGMDRWMELQFQRRNKTEWLMDWVRPGFQTLLKQGVGIQKSAEEMSANALMMASYTGSRENMAPIPCENLMASITLLGTRAEWKDLLGKLDPMEKGQFGLEPRSYALILRPILSRFVATFDIPNDSATRLFWNDMVTITARQKLCRTTELVTGWINAFHFWDGAGNLVLSAQASGSDNIQLDGVTFPWRHIKDIPTTHSHAPMCIGDNRGGLGTEVMVGMLMKNVKKGIPEDYAKAMLLAGLRIPPTVVEGDHSILQPLPAWIAHASRKVTIFHLKTSRRNTLTKGCSLGFAKRSN
jgi:hypothetical protein